MLKLNNIESQHAIEKIMPICLALFFCRTVFIGYKYLFFLLLVPCVVYSAYWLLKNGITKPKWRKLLFPLIVIALYLSHFTLLSNVVKESVNLLLILYFVSFADLYYAGDQSELFLKWIVRLTMLAGGLAIVRLISSLINIALPFSKILFEGENHSLVNDNNFYSLFFIISIIISTKMIANRLITKKEHLIVNIVVVINIVIGLSRRAYVLYALVLGVMSVFAVIRKNNYKETLLYNGLAVFIIGVVVGGVLLLSRENYSPKMTLDQKYQYYKMYSLIGKNTNFHEFDIIMLRRYYEQKQPHICDSNLFYNGDLRHGLDGWSFLEAPGDSIQFGLININGNNVLKVARYCCGGWWQVWYAGRPIIYHQNVTYQLSFTYRIIEGDERPFNVGWSVDEGRGYMVNLPQEIIPVDGVWNRCKVEYKFYSNQYNPTCFLNSLRPGTTIEVKDICLTCDDTTGLQHYIDQLPDSVIHRHYSRDTINYLTAPRTVRWRYALELWQTRYDTKQKIFGQGFKYLEWYGERFWRNPNRHDFPHNPIISSFLYSGIIGGVVYIIFLIMSLWLYWKRRKELGIFFIMYLCCMFFSMFSGSSHFSFPLFAFLSFVPFIEYKNRGETKENAC